MYTIETSEKSFSHHLNVTLKFTFIKGSSLGLISIKAPHSGQDNCLWARNDIATVNFQSEGIVTTRVTVPVQFINVFETFTKLIYYYTI